MTRKVWLATTPIAVASGLSGQLSWSQAEGVKAGTLTCNVASGWGFVFGSTHDLDCTCADSHGKVERYTGNIDQFGVDIGYHAVGIVAWAVLAPTADFDASAMVGTYVGVTAGAAVGIGGGANVLVGESDTIISLQPLSIEGMTGLNVAGGIAQIVLTRAPQ
jgi:hypothetical protein